MIYVRCVGLRSTPESGMFGDRGAAVTATFLLIRHAAHIHLDVRLSGRMPGVALSVAGYTQAAAMGRALARERIDQVLCSPLERTRDTAAAIATASGLPAPEAHEPLNEIDMGDWTGAAFGTLHGPAWVAWNSARGSARIPGGETMAEAQGRIVGFLQRLAGATEDRTIAVVTHGDMIRAAVAHAIDLPLDHLLRFDVAPASVSRVVMGDWGARLVSLNERLAA